MSCGRTGHCAATGQCANPAPAETGRVLLQFHLLRMPTNLLGRSAYMTCLWRCDVVERKGVR